MADHQHFKPNRTQTLELMDTSEDGDSTTTFVPPGYAVSTILDGLMYVIPKFMVPALDLTFEAYSKKVDIGVAMEKGGTHEVERLQTTIIGKGQVIWPCDPLEKGLSDRELLTLHAGVLALQGHLGISYKDAAHCLYMAELEKLKAEDSCYKAFTNLKVCIEAIMECVGNQAQDA